MKRILLFILALAVFSPAAAQDYYTQDGELKADEDITFKVELVGRLIFLDNTKNKLMFEREVYQDGRPYDDEFGEEDLVKSIPGGTIKAFMETFTREEYLRMHNAAESLITMSYMVSSNGDILEVNLSITGTPVMRAFPPSKYALLEKNLKKYVKCEVSPNGKKLKYIWCMSFANFSVLKLHYLAIDPGSETSDRQIPQDGFN